MANKCAVDACPENGAGALGLCTWHALRASNIKKAEGHIREYSSMGIGESDPRVHSCRQRIAQYERDMKQAKPTEARKSGRKATNKGTVRRAVDLFLQSPSIETTTAAKAAIDRYVGAQPRPPA